MFVSIIHTKLKCTLARVSSHLVRPRVCAYMYADNASSLVIKMKSIMLLNIHEVDGCVVSFVGS